MNKNAIKNYAVWARTELIGRVSQKAYEYEVTESSTPEYNTESVNGRLLTDNEKKQLNELISQVKKHGFDHVMEEVAYTWFNRFIALRFMEVNNYLPQKINVFTDGNNEFKPQILTEAIHLEIDGLDKNTVFELSEQDDRNHLFNYLLLSICNDMNKYLPDMFTPITDYKALLIPDHLLKEGSVLDRLINDIPEEDWTNQVQIIGWLYQYYNSDLKDIVMKKKSYTKDDIPAATQLFTPDWIVRYMVENSLGRLWLDGHPSFQHDHWKYYLEEAEQEPDVLEQLNKIRQEHAKIKPEEIKVLDPCMGSGHILVYAFDVLMDIYRDNGYSDREAARSIVENNIYGIEIDERAYQLAYFAIMMKARSYNRRILTENIKHNLVEITESNDFNKDLLHFLGEYKDMGRKLIDLFKDAKEFGSLINVDIPVETLDKIDERMVEIDQMADYGSLVVQADSMTFIQSIEPILKEARILAQKYEVVVTNPPYMAPTPKQKPFVQNYYPDSKSDLFAVFIERCHELNIKNGYQAMITMHSWMFLNSFEKLRNKLLDNSTIINMTHLGARAFEDITGEVVQTTSFCLLELDIKNYIGTYKRLVGCSSQLKEKCFFDSKYTYKSSSFNYYRMPQKKISYWASENVYKIFEKKNKFKEIAEAKSGIMTGDDAKFIRNWYEVDYEKIYFSGINAESLSNGKWFPLTRGGQYRKWYGNIGSVVNLENGGYEIKNNGKNYRLRDNSLYFRSGITWTMITTKNLSVRTIPGGVLFGNGGPSVFIDKDKEYYLALLNSVIINKMISFMNPTMNIVIDDIENLPIIVNKIDDIKSLSCKCTELSIIDWDSYETSWDFTVNPLIKQMDSLWDATGVGATIKSYYGKHIKVNSNMELCYHLWKVECNERFKQLKENEEELNRIFIDIYGLQDELTPEESDKDVTVHYVVDCKDDIPKSFAGSNYVRTKQDEIKSFISYAVGCMFGRYSLDVEGLAYADGEWDDSKYKRFTPDHDNIIPIYEDEFYGDDDITGRFIEFVKVVFGEDDLEENLKFIADSLGGKGAPRKVIRDYFINDFFKDHCQMYQEMGSGKHPIYWQFDSGKKNGFKALVYIHRYKPDLIARIRTEYVHPQQARYRNQLAVLENQAENASKSEEIKIRKEIQIIKAKADELAIYEEKIHHWADKMEPMDLDDGVVKNYKKFQELLVPNVVKKSK